MSYLVFCTFDLKNATAQDYRNAYSDLADIGLTKVHKSSEGGNVVIPTTAAMGEFNGTGSVQVRDYVRNKVTAAFTARGFKSEIFLTVGINWAWGAGAT